MREAVQPLNAEAINTALLQLVNQWLSSPTHVLPISTTNARTKTCFVKHRTHDFRISSCAKLPTRQHGRRVNTLNPIFSLLSDKHKKDDVGWDSRTRLARPNSRARTGLQRARLSISPTAVFTSFLWSRRIFPSFLGSRLR